MVNAVYGHADSVSGKVPLRRRQRRQILALVSASYLVDVLILCLFYFAGTTPAYVPLAYTSLAIVVCLVFLALSESGVYDRMSDHYNTVWQIIASTAIQLLFLKMAPEVGFVFLSILFIIFGFGSLRLNVHQAALVWTVAVVGVAAVMLSSESVIVIPSAHRLERITTLFCFILTLGRCVFLGLYGSGLRDTLRRRNLELKAAVSRINELASIDMLTGIMNRRSIVEMLDEEMARVRRTDLPLSIALMDLDWFKTINDQHGHAVGDQVLRKVAATVTGAIRLTDRFGRYGGEEFLLILPSADKCAAAQIVDRIRVVVATTDWTTMTPGFSVTISSGVAAFQKTDTPSAFVARADAALYASKRAGRNCVSLA